MTALLVMLNNYFHDLSVAVFFVATVALLALRRETAARPAAAPVLVGVDRTLRRWMGGSLALVLLLGGVRAWFYGDYEWHEAAGRGQVGALVAKHLVLGGLVIAGLFAAFRGRRARPPDPRV